MSDGDKIDEVLDHLEKEENLNLDNYKEKDPEGIGDILERAFMKFGVTEEWIKKAMGTAEDCGCEKRKNFLNKIFPFRRPKS